MDLDSKQPEFDPGMQISEVIERIDLKLSRNKNAIRANWFSIARQAAEEALSIWRTDPKRAILLLSKCENYLLEGNKAHQRKTSFVVGPQVEIEKTTT